MHVVNYRELGYKSHILKWFSISYVLNFPNLSPRETRFILKRYTLYSVLHMYLGHYFKFYYSAKINFDKTAYSARNGSFAFVSILNLQNSSMDFRFKLSFFV